ncbi:hypothetical protein [Mucilaginibacter sp.]|jgi:hypothetical protein|uniref:hypothetical protein n=1 Tax=Mucilaginibacter sp. TaxID=1882438 RepID=UPI003569F645
MKFPYLFVILLIANLSGKAQSATGKVATVDSALSSLKSKKAAIDKYVDAHKKQMGVFVKAPNKKALIRVYNEKWPEEIEYTYNIIKDKAGKIIYILQTPFSESGDWDILYEHYFDESGNVFAFFRVESIFDDNVKGGVVRNKLLKYYNKDFKVVKQNNWLTDTNGGIVKANANTFNFRGYNYTIYKNLAECLKGYNIKAF